MVGPWLVVLPPEGLTTTTKKTTRKRRRRLDTTRRWTNATRPSSSLVAVDLGGGEVEGGWTGVRE